MILHVPLVPYSINEITERVQDNIDSFKMNYPDQNGITKIFVSPSYRMDEVIRNSNTGDITVNMKFIDVGIATYLETVGWHR